MDFNRREAFLTRRIYYTDPQSMKKRQACQEAMLNMRAARQNIDPELLNGARQAIADGLERARTAREQAAAEAGVVPVDRQKNLSVIMQYLELNRNNQALLGKVKDLMTEA